MGRGDAELLTDFCRLGTQVLAHEEHPAGARGQPAEALFQDLEELLALERLLGPGLRRLAPVAGGIKQGVEILQPGLALQGLLPRGAANGVDDLVLEDAGQPGAQLRAAGEALLRGERRDEGFLDGVLGGLAVAKLQRGVAQQVRPLRFDLVP